MKYLFIILLLSCSAQKIEPSNHATVTRTSMLYISTDMSDCGHNKKRVHCDTSKWALYRIDNKANYYYKRFISSDFVDNCGLLDLSIYTTQEFDTSILLYAGCNIKDTAN